MLNGKKVVAIIPARAGSKGIPGKNKYILLGKTLTEWAYSLALCSQEIDIVVITTDDEEILEQALKVPELHVIKRPPELSGDQVHMYDVVEHALESIGEEDPLIVLLQPTSPLRSSDDLNGCLEAWKRGNAEAVVSVVQLDSPHPSKMQIVKDGYLNSLMGADSGTPRQLLPKVYVPNGAFYVIERKVLQSHKKFLPPKTVPFIMPQVRSINLDNELDLILLEAVISKQMVKPVIALTD